jgi:hypothetical protein
LTIGSLLLQIKNEAKADQHVIPEQKNNLENLPSCDQDLLIALVKFA